MMRDVLIITAREIRDKKLLFLGAALCAVIVLVTPLLPGARNENPSDVMTAAALALSIVALIATPLALGSGIIGRDLEERRMGFYLARPVNTFSVWSGKTLGALLISLGLAFIIVLIPTLMGKGLLSVGNYAANMRTDGMWMYAFMGAPLRNVLLVSLLLLALAQFWGLGLRTRSAWLLLDLVILVFVGFTFWTSVRPFLLNGSETTAIAFAVLFIALLTILTMAGNAIGLQLGRSDLQRTHQWTSIVTAGLLVAGAVGFAVYSHWDRSIDPASYHYSALRDAPDEGPWIAVEGARKPEWNSYWTAHLLNTETGESVAIPNSFPRISDNGRFAALWSRETIDPPSARLHWIDLQNPDEIHRTDVSTPLGFRNVWGLVEWPQWAISPAGGRVAWVEGDTVQAHELQKETSLFSAKLPGEGRSDLTFDGESVLYVFTHPHGGEGQWTIRKAELEAKSWSVTGTIPSGRFYASPPDSNLRFIGERAPGEDERVYQLRNIEDGSVVSNFAAGSGRFLGDGRFVEIEGDTTTRLRVYGQNEQLQKAIELPIDGLFRSPVEVAPGLLAIPTLGRDRTGSTTYLVDLETSEIRRLDPALRILHSGTVSLGSEPGKAIVGDGHSIFLLNLETLDTERIAGRD